ncbi:MAG: hypothetical protein Q4F03_06715 [Eubacteriales bacterium]|nr:hypothetical protein [Eubacteriales bacterium]
MKITQELIDSYGDKKERLSDGVIMPDGDYRLLEKGHLQTLMDLLPESDNEIWKMIPEDDSALFWMVEKTGCVLTDYNTTIGMKMTPQQQTVFDLLVNNRIIEWEYSDLTKQREMVHKKENAKKEK